MDLKKLENMAYEGFQESRLFTSRDHPEAFFEQIAYTWEEEEANREFNELWSKRIPLVESETVLDVGCGQGHLLSLLTAAGLRYGLEPATSCHNGLRMRGIEVLERPFLELARLKALPVVDHVICCRSIYAASLLQGHFYLLEALHTLLRQARISLSLMLKPRELLRGIPDDRDSGLWPLLILVEMGYAPRLEWVRTGNQESALIQIVHGVDDEA